MTENEIIERLKCMRLFMEINDKQNESKFLEDDYIANKTAIQALEEIQQYRAIGTVEELQALKEKNVGKKPDYEGDGCWDGHIVIDIWICPNCEKHYEVDYDDYDYCPNCGQHIDHSGLTEDD